MKIQKAMEKVKKMQLDDKLNTAESAKSGKVESRMLNNKWASPVYSDSQCFEIDNVKAIESRCVCLSPDAPELEYYKVLRTQIVQRTMEEGKNSIMITSVQPGEGKIVTSINLALTFAKAYNQTVLLVDCDLRQQKIHQYLGIDSNKGIADYLLNGQPLKDIIICPRVEKFTLISGGKTINDSSELLGSHGMRDLVEQMKSRYDDRYVLFDVPPILSGADTITLSPLVDGIIVVVDPDKTSLKEVKEAMELIPKEKFLGFVLNRYAATGRGYYDYYGGGSKA